MERLMKRCNSIWYVKVEGTWLPTLDLKMAITIALMSTPRTEE